MAKTTKKAPAKGEKCKADCIHEKVHEFVEEALDKSLTLMKNEGVCMECGLRIISDQMIAAASAMVGIIRDQLPKGK